MSRWILLVCCLCAQSAYSLSWNDLWYNNNQQAIQAYKNKQHKQAELRFSKEDNATGHYNRGNALAQQKKFKEAIQAYDEALKRQPDMADATFNRDLLKKLMQQQQPQNQNDQQKKQQQQQQQQQQNNQQSQANEDKKDPQDNPQKKQDLQSQQAQEKQKQEQMQQEKMTEQQEKQEQEKNQQQQRGGQQQNAKEREQQQSQKQVLRRVPDDPGGLLRRKFLRDYQRRQMESNTW